MSSEYNNTMGGSSCNYSQLGQYTNSYSMNGTPFQGRISSGAYIVPTWSAIGYDSLTAKVPSCSGYSDINAAYGSDAGDCQTTYNTSLCGNGGGQ